MFIPELWANGIRTFGRMEFGLLGEWSSDFWVIVVRTFGRMR